KWTPGRLTSVVVVVSCAFLIIFGLGATLGQQLTQVAERLPLYQYTIKEKIRGLRDATTGGGTIERVSRFLSDLNQEIVRKEDKATQPAPARGDEQKIIPVEMHQPRPTPYEVIRNVLQPLAEPLTSIGLVVI